VHAEQSGLRLRGTSLHATAVVCNHGHTTTHSTQHDTTTQHAIHTQASETLVSEISGGLQAVYEAMAAAEERGVPGGGPLAGSVVLTRGSMWEARLQDLVSGTCMWGVMRDVWMWG
jgi:hypothetical protein